MTRANEAALATAATSQQVLAGKLSPGPGLPPSEVAHHQRARIHSAIVEIAGERGQEAVTIREIARLSGVSSRAFYRARRNASCAVTKQSCARSCAKL